MDPSFAHPEGNVPAPSRMLCWELGRRPDGELSGRAYGSEAAVDLLRRLKRSCTSETVQPKLGREPRYGSAGFTVSDLTGVPFLLYPTPPSCGLTDLFARQMCATTADPSMPSFVLGATFSRLPHSFAETLLGWAKGFGNSFLSVTCCLRFLLLLSLCSALASRDPSQQRGKTRPLGMPARAWHPELLLCLGAACSPRQHAKLDLHYVLFHCSPVRPAKAKRRTTTVRGTTSRCLITLLLGFCNLPVCVWAVPPGLPEAVDVVHNVVNSMPEDLPAAGGTTNVPVRGDALNAEASQEGDHLQRHPPEGEQHMPQLLGIPEPTHVPGMPTAAATRRVPFAAYVITPFYQAELFTFLLQLPCEEMDTAREVGRHMTGPVLAYTDVIVPVSPQPCERSQAYVRYPAWTSFAGLVAIALDLRLTPLNKTGPITAAFFTCPTNKAELCREAGVFSIRRCNIYVCDSPIPLGEHEQVFLENGMLVRFVPVPEEPSRLPKLHARLHDLAAWHEEQEHPPVLPAATLMLLHERGRFLFNRAPAPGTSVEVAIADFIGVPRASITMRSPADGYCEHFSYRGNNIRGLIACAPSRGIADGNLVVYLDFRQIASAIQFVLLPSPRLAYADIDRLLPRPPPDGWRLAIQGGRRHRHFLEVQPGETLIFGFIHDSVPAFELDSSSSDNGDHRGRRVRGR